MAEHPGVEWLQTNARRFWAQVERQGVRNEWVAISGSGPATGDDGSWRRWSSYEGLVFQLADAESVVDVQIDVALGASAIDYDATVVEDAAWVPFFVDLDVPVERNRDSDQ